MKELNLPGYSYRLGADKTGRKQIYDILRKKWVTLTPEEWVRQHFINYLIEYRKYPPGLLASEVTFKMNNLVRRVDIMAYSRNGDPAMIVECKAPEVSLNKKVFDQAVTYNMKFRLGYLVMTNGLQHYSCAINWEKGTYSFIEEIPAYTDLANSR